MPRIALVHALSHPVAPVKQAFARDWPAAACMNLLGGELAPGAMAALNRGDRATHDAAVVAAARRLAARGAALIALAQFSMAHVAHAAGQATGLPVLTTVDGAVAAMRHRLA